MNNQDQRGTRTRTRTPGHNGDDHGVVEGSNPSDNEHEKSLSFLGYYLRRKFYGAFLKPGQDNDHGAVKVSNPSDNEHLSDNDSHSEEPGHNDDHGAVEGSNPSDNDPHSEGSNSDTDNVDKENVGAQENLTGDGLFQDANSNFSESFISMNDVSIRNEFESSANEAVIVEGENERVRRRFNWASCLCCCFCGDR